MIGNITRGRKAAGALRYDFGPGRRDEHLEPRFVAGTVPGTPQQVARLIDHHTRQRSDIKAPIWRVSLSVPDEDGELDDRVWAQIATTYVARMGFGACPWVAVRHGHDHVHLTVSRLGWDGRMVDNGRDWLRNRTVLDGIEQEHGLVRAVDRYRETNPGVRSGAELAASQRRGAVRPEREQIRAAAQAARDAAAGLGREAFEAELTARGIDHRANVASTGRMNGYSLSLPSWLDGDGVQIWVPASKAGRELAWGKLGPVIARQEPTGPPALDRTGRTPVDGDQAEQAEQAGSPERPEGRLPESIAPPVDPAARLLAAVRAARAAVEAGEEVPEIPQRPDPAREMDRRPHGWLTGAGLAQARTAAVRTLADRQAALDEATSAAMRLDGIASGVSTGAQLAALTGRREQLETAVGHLAEATAATTAAEGHAAQAAAARTVEAESLKQAGRSRLVLAALFTTPAAEREMAKTAAEFAGQQERAAAKLRREAAAASTRARQAAPGVEEPEDELAALTQDWKRLERTARQGDIDIAKVLRADARGAVQDGRGAVARARQALAGVEEEIAHRATLAPPVLAAEDRLRAEHEQTLRAGAARGRSTTASTGAPKKAGPVRPPTPTPPRPPQPQPRREPPTR
ncbi:relaxase/mobilization nuclease domain-containing protein [Kitasatospora indigofera]|uniref:relaxase/mobilization nuclease domain-containing protein n=1 Tax=Kitasatospora indigofera TaxID=67307 RepID=UPI0033B86863